LKYVELDFGEKNLNKEACKQIDGRENQLKYVGLQ
jgi:hypothetical protein